MGMIGSNTTYWQGFLHGAYLEGEAAGNALADRILAARKGDMN